MVTWPCLLKLDGDDELIYLRSQADLDSECEALILGPDDHVIDSNGNTFGCNTTIRTPPFYNRKNALCPSRKLRHSSSRMSFVSHKGASSKYTSPRYSKQLRH